MREEKKLPRSDRGVSYKDGGGRSGDGLAAGGDDADDGDDAAAAGVRARGPV